MKKYLFIAIIFLLSVPQTTQAVTLNGGSVREIGDIFRQTLDFSQTFPKALSFRKCLTRSGCQSSDNPLFECYANTAIPDLPNIISELKISSPQPTWNRPEKIWIKTTDDRHYPNRNYATWDADSNNFSGPAGMLISNPTYKDGQLILNFDNGPYDKFFGSNGSYVNARFGKVCGIPVDYFTGALSGESQALQDRMSLDYLESVNTRRMNTNFRISINWKKSQQGNIPGIESANAKEAARGVLTSLPIEVDINGEKISKTIPYSLPNKPQYDLQDLRQNKGSWANENIATNDGSTYQFKDRGGVATSITTLLSGYVTNSSSAGNLWPNIVGQELVADGAWQVGNGVNWQGIKRYFNKYEGFVAEEISLPVGIEKLEEKIPLLTAYTYNQQHRTAVLLGFDGEQFTAYDPLVGETNLEWDTLTQGEPWIIQLTQK